MTLEQLEKLSDEELNRKAHELMGKCWHWRMFDGTFFKCSKCDSNAYDKYTNPNYCRDFNDAFKLVEWAESQESFCVISCDTKAVEFYQLREHELAGEVSETLSWATSKSIPRAITIAFILAFDKE